MFEQFRLYVIGAIVGAFSLLVLYAKHKLNRAEYYKKEAALQKEAADSTEKRIDAHEKRDEIEQDNANADESSVNDKLQQYYRD